MGCGGVGGGGDLGGRSMAQAGEGRRGSKNPEIESPGLVYGRAIGKSCGGRRRGLVGCWRCGGCDDLGGRSMASAGAGVWGQNSDTEPPGLGQGRAVENGYRK